MEQHDSSWIANALHRCFSHIGTSQQHPTSVSKLLSEWSEKTTFLESVASDAYLFSKISLKLLKYLGVGYRWMLKFGALGVYAMLLMPGFIQVGYEYFNDKKIHRNIIFGTNPRNRLDLYVPENGKSPKPIVVFITGGAWIIGHRAWGCLLGLQLVERNVIVACVDYRNFPQGTVGDMVEDVTQGISFIIKNAAHFGGDTNRIYLAGQSAGAHLAACALLEQAIKDCNMSKGQIGKFEMPNIDPTNEYSLWKASQLKAFFGISGGYNLKELVDYFDKRGLYKSLFYSIMEGEGSLLRFSPERRVQCLSDTASTMLPDMYLFHGTSDKSIPSSASKSFADVLASYGVHVGATFYEHKTHTDVFIQDPMRGGHDALLEDILLVVHDNDKEAQIQDVIPRRRLVPEFLLQLAHVISPF